MSTTATGPTTASVWRAARAPLLVAALVLVTGFVVAVVSGQQGGGLLDPASTDPGGSRALATLLTEQGVMVTATEDPAEAAAAAGDAATTVLVTFPERLSASALAGLADGGADLVVVAPTGDALTALAPTVREAGSTAPGEVAAPGCHLAVATRAGAAEVGGLLYETEGVPGCYRHDGGAALVMIHEGSRAVAVLGDATPLTNEHLASEGNAALTLALLGQHERLVWLRPTTVAAGGDEGVGALVPAGVWWGLVQAAVAVVLLALWRARRLGPVVVEPLPVVVPASETTEGRGRLYWRTRARGPAAEALRSATRARVRALLGLAPSTGSGALVAAVAAAGRRPVSDVREILYGNVPADEPGLVALAEALDTLEREVRRP